MSTLARVLRGAASWLELRDQAPTVAPPMGPRISDDGLVYSEGQWSDEYHDDLDSWQERVARFDEMRTGSATVAAQFEAVLEPILRSTPEVDAGEPWELPMERPPVKPPPLGLPAPPPEKGKDAPQMAEDDPPEPDAEPEEAKPVTGDARKAELAAELVRANLLGKSPLREYRMRTSWRQFLGELYTSEEFGFSLHERILRRQDGELGSLVVYDHLSWIHPKSIHAFHLAKDGTFLGVTQTQTGGYYDKAGLDGGFHTRGSQRVFIQARKLYLRTRRREGDDVTGRALSRAMYATHKRLSFFEKAQIIDAQKRAIGIPFYRMGPTTPKENRAEAIKQAKAMRAGNERTFLVLQGEDEVGFVDMTANAAMVDGYVSSAKADIAAVAGTEFKRLGAEGRGGSEALASVQEPHFNLHVESVATSLVESIQRSLIEPLHDVNFLGTPPPVLRLESSSPPNITPVVEAKNAGLLGPWRGEDAQAQRKALRLAPLRDDEMDLVTERAMAPPVPTMMGPDGKPMPAPDGKPVVGKDGKPEQPPKPEKELAEGDPAASATRGTIEPSEREKRFIRLGEIEREFDRLTQRLTPRLRRLWETLAEEVAPKLQANGGGAVRLAGRPKRAGLERLLRDAAESMRVFGKAQAEGEIERQVRALTEPDKPPQFDDVDPSVSETMFSALAVRTRVAAELETAVVLDVDALLSTMEQGLIRGYLDAMRGGATASAAQGTAVDTLLMRSDALFDNIGRDLAIRAFNGGRAEAVAEFRNDEDAEATVRVAVRTEVLDGATCPPCRGLHGTRVAVDSDDYWLYQPPAMCDGGSNCRGFYDFVVEEA